MYFHFNKTEPFHKYIYRYSNKNQLCIGQGKLSSFSKECSVYDASVCNRNFLVEVINRPEKNKTTADPMLSGREVAKFSFENGAQGKVSWMFKKTGKTGFLGIQKRYFWWDIVVDGMQYQMYRVGFGKDGFYFQINQGDQVLAMIEKEIHVKNFCDGYDVYIEDENVLEAVLVALAYIDLGFYNHYLERSVLDNATVLEHTKLPELLERFDPDFIPRMRKQEGM